MKRPLSSPRSLAAPVLLAVAACTPAAPPAQSPPPQQYAPPPQPYPPQGYPPPQAYGPPPQGYPPPAYAPQPAPPPAQQPQPLPAPAPQPSRPLLPPLVGSLAWQAEVRGVIAEDIAALAPENQARVRGIPLVFDPNPFEVNAYAMCDEHGSPGIVGTEGLLEAIDAIAQTRATDELYGTRTYDQYMATVMPGLAQSDKASAALPVGIIPLNVVADPRRWSRAHEWYDEIVAFTFGHELSHHWLGHTGCAHGPPNPLGLLPSLASKAGGGFVQLAESQADTEGTNTMLAAGRARQPQYRWTEEGGLALLDFFLRLETAAGPKTPLGQFAVSFLNTHPSSRVRIPIVQTATMFWRQQHPG